MGIVYILIDKTNNLSYVGQTIRTFKDRWTDHLTGKQDIDIAIKDHKPENFDFIFEENIPEEFLDLIEISMIQSCDSFGINGYNRTTGGSSHKHISEDSKKKMSESKKGENHPMWGKHQSLQTIKKRSNAMKGNKNGIGNKGKIRKKRAFRNLTQEHIEKISKSILQFTKDGHFIREWKSGTQVQKELRINKTHIGSVCKDKRKSAGGFIWKYAD